MIFGRPTNLWLGLVTAFGAAVSGTALVLGADPAIVAALVTGWSGVLGAGVLLVANQPPSIKVGDDYTVVTPGTAPNVEKVANAFPTPPANLVAK